MQFLNHLCDSNIPSGAVDVNTFKSYLVMLKMKHYDWLFRVSRLFLFN